MSVLRHRNIPVVTTDSSLLFVRIVIRIVFYVTITVGGGGGGGWLVVFFFLGGRGWFFVFVFGRVISSSTRCVNATAVRPVIVAARSVVIASSKQSCHHKLCVVFQVATRHPVSPSSSAALQGQGRPVPSRSANWSTAHAPCTVGRWRRTIPP